MNLKHLESSLGIWNVNWKLAISMQLFWEILTKISQIENVVEENKDILISLC